MFFHVNTRNGCVVLTCSSVKHSFKTKSSAYIMWLINRPFRLHPTLHLLSSSLSSSTSLSLPLFPFIRGEVLPATFSPPHLLFFSTLLCLLSSSSSLPPLLSSSHLSLHSPPISVLASLVSSCPALVTLPLTSVVGHRPSFLRVQPIVICS